MFVCVTILLNLLFLPVRVAAEASPVSVPLLNELHFGIGYPSTPLFASTQPDFIAALLHRQPAFSEEELKLVLTAAELVGSVLGDRRKPGGKWQRAHLYGLGHCALSIGLSAPLVAAAVSHSAYFESVNMRKAKERREAGYCAKRKFLNKMLGGETERLLWEFAQVHGHGLSESSVPWILRRVQTRREEMSEAEKGLIRAILCDELEASAGFDFLWSNNWKARNKRYQEQTVEIAEGLSDPLLASFLKQTWDHVNFFYDKERPQEISGSFQESPVAGRFSQINETASGVFRVTGHNNGPSRAIDHVQGFSDRFETGFNPANWDRLDELFEVIRNETMRACCARLPDCTLAPALSQVDKIVDKDPGQFLEFLWISLLKGESHAKNKLGQKQDTTFRNLGIDRILNPTADFLADRESAGVCREGEENGHCGATPSTRHGDDPASVSGFGSSSSSVERYERAKRNKRRGEKRTGQQKRRRE